MAWVKFFRKPGTPLGKGFQPGSMLSLAPTKGLLNEPGQNSCFLNSAVQVLWQLDIFRRSLRELQGHICLGDACIFCALKSIFAQFQLSREKALPSDILRNAMAETFKEEHRFQLGLMDDAAECFENILERIHFHIVPSSEADACTSKSCITHQKFAMTLYEQCVCRNCGATSDPLPFTEFVHYVSTTALCDQVDRMTERQERLKPDMFAELLQAASTAGDYRNCPSNCGQKIKIRRVLMNCPEIVTIGLVWDSEHSDLTEEVMRCLGPQFYLPGLFYRATDERAKSSELLLVGMICYTSKHYCAFAYHSKTAKWVLFDDANVKEVGSRWKDVVYKCCRNHFQPLLLFFANLSGTAVSTEDAPKQIIHWSPYRTPLLNGQDLMREQPVPKKADFTKEIGTREYLNQSNPRTQPSDNVFSRGNIQASGGRGPVKVNPDEQKDRIRDLSRELNQKVGDMRHFSHPPRKEADRGPRKQDASGPRDFLAENRSYLKQGSSPMENGFRQHPDPRIFSSQGKGPLKHEKAIHHTRSLNEPRPNRPLVLPTNEMLHNKSRSDAAGGYDTDSSQSSKDKGNVRSRNKGWKPVRETLNVDSVFHGNEKNQNSPRDKTNIADRSQGSKHPASYPKEERKTEVLMTIYEDDLRQEMGSRSSLESMGKGNAEKEKTKGGPNLKVRNESWQMQRTESGYESSDLVSNSSTTLDSPVLDGTNAQEDRTFPEAGSSSSHTQAGKLLENSGHFTSQESKIQFEGMTQSGFGLERDLRPQDYRFTESNLHKSSPQLQRTQQVPFSLQPHHSSSQQPVLRDRFREESRTPLNDSGRISHVPKTKNSGWPSSDSETLSVLLGSSNGSFPSCASEHSDDHKLSLNVSQTSLQFHNAATRTTAIKPEFANFVKPVSTTELSTSDQIPQEKRDEAAYRVSEHVYQNMPPPLPLKKYKQGVVGGTAQRAPTMDTRPTEEIFQASSPFKSALTALKSKLEGGHLLHSAVQKNSFEEKESSIPKSVSECSHSNPGKVISAGAAGVFTTVSHDPGTCASSSETTDSISPTTYFSVDGCMTDTYRVKYHQRPKLYFAEYGSQQEGRGQHSFSEMGPGSTSQGSHSMPYLSPQQRSKPVLESGVNASLTRANAMKYVRNKQAYW